MQPAFAKTDTPGGDTPAPDRALASDGDGPSRLERLWFLLRMLRDPLATVSERFARYGDLYRSPSSATPLFVTRDADCIREVLVAQPAVFGKGHASFRMLRTVLGDSLLTSEGEDWRRQRRLVQPAFARARLAEYAAVMADEAHELASRLASPGWQRHDVSRLMTAVTLRVVGRTLFGRDVDESPRIGRGMRWLNQAFGRPELLPASIPTRTRLRARRAQADLDGAVRDVIQERRRLLARGEAPPGDLLQRLLDARDEEDGGRLSDVEIRDQLLTLYLAGHDTTSHTLAWALYLLSQSPAALGRLRAEVRQVLGGRVPTFDDLSELPYTEAVFKEAMRLYPPVALLPRRANVDTQLGPLAVPAGSEIVIWVYHAHRDPRYWREPEQFRPERFLGDEDAARPRHAYLPFGAGQRACIGQLFAIIEGQLILAELAQRVAFGYTARRHPGIRLGVTMAPRRGVPMRLRAL